MGCSYRGSRKIWISGHVGFHRLVSNYETLCICIFISCKMENRKRQEVHIARFSRGAPWSRRTTFVVPGSTRRAGLHYFPLYLALSQAYCSIICDAIEGKNIFTEMDRHRISHIGYLLSLLSGTRGL